MDAKTLGSQHAGVMTKREELAKAFGQGIVACYPCWPVPDDGPRVAQIAVALADALLAELAKDQP